jgi:hypothetical protein
MSDESRWDELRLSRAGPPPARYGKNKAMEKLK